MTRTFALVREFRAAADLTEDGLSRAIYTECAERLTTALHEDLEETLARFHAADGAALED